ncbi:hypothetical protein T440DRAFT_182544 [Plenodomus tracheiphilus IPT5]|uniref:Uncharacterized protein n=1 Tax=Plenodomus tracheiphilus IPT5 TaxID=1408161 RepID=A0A6A7B093_9PLEO|nr:hypothetical protein T440DRAFT_182544 [Plenodomus tracheiphilus IPT5]
MPAGYDNNSMAHPDDRIILFLTVRLYDPPRTCHLLKTQSHPFDSVSSFTVSVSHITISQDNIPLLVHIMTLSSARTILPHRTNSSETHTTPAVAPAPSSTETTTQTRSQPPPYNDASKQESAEMKAPSKNFEVRKSSESLPPYDSGNIVDIRGAEHERRREAMDERERIEGKAPKRKTDKRFLDIISLADQIRGHLAMRTVEAGLHGLAYLISGGSS